jgi:LDH2 family malate/lactate/ureidoglycolate dehydrogenase
MVETERQHTAVRVRAADVLTLGRALLERAGAPPEHAQIIVEHLIAASAMGLHSHGIMRIPQYLAEIESGLIDAGAQPEIAQTGTSRLSVDGRRGFGQVVGMRMVEALVPVARAPGSRWPTAAAWVIPVASGRARTPWHRRD